MQLTILIYHYTGASQVNNRTPEDEIILFHTDNITNPMPRWSLMCPIEKLTVGISLLFNAVI